MKKSLSLKPCLLDNLNFTFHDTPTLSGRDFAGQKTKLTPQR